LIMAHNHNQSAQLAKTHYDVIIVGGGHNGLVAAAYLAKAGRSVLVLERKPYVGGAAISAHAFDGIDARLSRYSYLVSLFPQQIIDDLGLRFESRKRAVASFTPVIQDNQHKALLISNTSDQRSSESFHQLTGSDDEFEAFQRFYQLTGALASCIWPTLLQPLVTREELHKQFTNTVSDDAKIAWEMFIEQPLGIGLERMVRDDVVRGVIFTDAKIGVLTHPHDASLLQNRTLLYHVIGNLTGDWRVPVGGMGALTSELERCARTSGAEIITSADVQHISPTSPDAEIEYVQDGHTYRAQARYVLANVAPTVLASMLTDSGTDPMIEGGANGEGSVFKINMLLRRLPRLRASSYRPEEAFAGTFHLDEHYNAMQQSYRLAVEGKLPDYPPGEMYCHSLTDPSILSPELSAQGYHTLTLFGVDMPYRLFKTDNESVREEALNRYLAALNRYLEEPIQDCFAIDANGKPCIEAKSPVDLETELNMPLGHIFHGDLSWPFVETAERRGMWGVETRYPNIFFCGSGALRGGCVSGIPGHNAARKVLECG
jgi:phytoene dehydrogenase-like protein